MCIYNIDRWGYRTTRMANPIYIYILYYSFELVHPSPHLWQHVQGFPCFFRY